MQRRIWLFGGLLPLALLAALHGPAAASAVADAYLAVFLDGGALAGGCW